MVWRYITGKEERINVKMKIEKNTQSFTDQINSLKFLNKKYTVKTGDAYIDLSDRNFTIVKEVQGDNIDKSKVPKRSDEPYRRRRIHFGLSGIHYARCRK